MGRKTEATEQIAVVKYCDFRRFLCFHCPNEQKRGGYEICECIALTKVWCGLDDEECPFYKQDNRKTAKNIVDICKGVLEDDEPAD